MINRTTAGAAGDASVKAFSESPSARSFPVDYASLSVVIVDGELFMK